MKKTIPILIIHNLVRQFQFSFVLFLFLIFFFIFFFFSLVRRVARSFGRPCATHRVMNRAEQPRSEQNYAVHFSLFALT